MTTSLTRTYIRRSRPEQQAFNNERIRRLRQELNMTQAAVSYGMKQLEAALGVDLFRREHQRVRLTDDGRRYHQDVTLALEHIRRSTETLRRSQSGAHVTLSCSTAFAS